MRTNAVAVYLFDAMGTPLARPASRDPMPIEPEQIEGILAAVGSFGGPRSPASRDADVTRMRYDRYRVIGVRGERTVMAAVFSDPSEEPPVEDLHRLLHRLEGDIRLPRLVRAGRPLSRLFGRGGKPEGSPAAQRAGAGPSSRSTG